MDVTSQTSTAALSIHGLTKFFGATRALRGVDLTVGRGQIHALLGENGAGKSTLIKILAGVHVPDSGEIILEGSPIQPWLDRSSSRISFIHQDLGLIETMTIADNIALTTGFPMSRGFISQSETRRRASEALDALGVSLPPDRGVSTLTSAERSIVAIARALAQECSVLILDEPTATLPQADCERLFAVLFRLRARGMGIVYVTHRLDEVFRIADHVSVLRSGRLVASMPIADTKPDDLVLKIIGKPPSEIFGAPALARDDAVLDVKALRGDVISALSFQLRRGEILGLVGLRGAGHDTSGRILFGLLPRWSGVVECRSHAVAPNSIQAAMEAGLGFVSSKRNEESLAGSMTVRENLFLNPRGTEKVGAIPFNAKLERRRAQAAMTRFGVRPADAAERAVGTLSGGNAQKVVLARWLELGSDVLILEEPTMGVDVGAKAEIYGLLRSATEAGLAVILVSSDFEEVSKICHRAFVFVDGQVRSELPRQSLSIETLTRLASAA